MAAAAAAALLGTARAAVPTPDPTLDVYLKPQTLAVLPDGRRANFFCVGEGGPVAILEAGWSVFLIRWRRLQTRFAQITRVCAFERPGYGFSDPGPMPRDTAAGVADLHAALKAAGIPPPYVLVGHSLGGFDARLVAYTYPAETAGLLLLDPPTEKIYQRDRQPDEDLDLVRRCIAIAKTRALVAGDKDGCVLPPTAQFSTALQAKVSADDGRVSFLETILSEDPSMVGRSADELAAAKHSLGDMPLILLQADTDCRTNGPPPKTDDEKFDVDRCVELESQARDSARGQRRVIEGATHQIDRDKPEVVVAAFREVIDAARATEPSAVQKMGASLSPAAAARPRTGRCGICVQGGEFLSN